MIYISSTPPRIERGADTSSISIMGSGYMEQGIEKRWKVGYSIATPHLRTAVRTSRHLRTLESPPIRKFT